MQDDKRLSNRTGVVPLDGVDRVPGRRGVGEDAGVAGLNRDVEELHRVATTRREQRRRRIHESHRIRPPRPDRKWLRIADLLGFGLAAGSCEGLEFRRWGVRLRRRRGGGNLKLKWFLLA